MQNPAPPPVARCTPLVTLTVPPGQCTATFTQAALIALIDAGSTSPNSALTLSLQPLPSNGPSYILTQGQTYTFTLDATNTGGTSTCESFVTVKPVPLPVASCAPTLMLAATAKCEAHPDAATLLQAINAGSTGGMMLFLEPFMFSLHGHTCLSRSCATPGLRLWHSILFEGVLLEDQAACCTRSRVPPVSQAP